MRYAGCCGYCGVREDDAGAELTIDHYRPRSYGGAAADDDENLVYCCSKCNAHKGAYWHETDPPHIRLLHPLHDNMAAHLLEAETSCRTILVMGYFVMVIASASQRSNLFKISRLLRQKTPRNDCNFKPKRV
jgi:hypothetical protein